MSRIKIQWLALGLCLLFAAFSLGYWLGSRPSSGAYTIRAEIPPPGAEYYLDSTAPPPFASSSGAPFAVSPSSTPAGAAKDARININTASAEELTDLPGIGPVLAQRIVDHRAERGPFAVLEDLINVPGIGEKTYENLKKYITF